MIDLDELERIGKAATFVLRDDTTAAFDDLTTVANGRFVWAACNNWQAMIDELRQFREVSRQIIKHHDRGSLAPSGDSSNIEKLRTLIVG